MASSLAAQPLSDVAPWSVERPCTVLVSDAEDCDGRFVGYSLAFRALESGRSVLWLEGGARTEGLVSRSLRRLGWEGPAGRAPPRASPSAEPGWRQHGEWGAFSVRSLTVEFAEYVTGRDKETPDGSSGVAYADGIDSDPELNLQNPETFLRDLFFQIKQWLHDSVGPPPWIVLDDISTFAVLVGESVAYSFVSTLCGLSESVPFGFLVRCAGDAANSAARETVAAGLLSVARLIDPSGPKPSLEVTLLELADHVVDVTALAGGPTRNVHGRLVFTSFEPQGKVESRMFNFCLQDNKVQVIRVRR